MYFAKPESHDQVFFAQFSYIISVKGPASNDSLLRAPVGNFIAQPCENENQCLESLAEFLQGTRTELYFSSKFSKSRRSQRRKLSF